MENKTLRFALIGLAGFVAPRHLKAIKEIGGTLVAALDNNDSVGIVDSYFPNASFFTEFERFDRFLEKLKRSEGAIDFLVVCSPNYLHDAHIRLGLRYGAHVICEKPLVLNPWNIDALRDIESETKGKISTILQLRLHPTIKELKKNITQASYKDKYDVNLTYLTSRGNWYYASWKGDIKKSGGIATNIGIHFFDMLIWVFGPIRKQEVHVHTHDRAGGYIELEKANVKWFLGINSDLLPQNNLNKKAFRNIEVNGESLEFTSGFEELHTESYRNIVQQNGFGLDDAQASIDCVHQIRQMEITKDPTTYHPLILEKQSIHPFDR